jgi:hypothetical protein
MANNKFGCSGGCMGQVEVGSVWLVKGKEKTENVVKNKCFLSLH